MTAADQGAPPPPPPPPPQAGGGSSPRSRRQAPSIPPGEIVVIAGGVLMLIFSFLAWYKLDETAFTEGQSWSAWSNAFNLFPLATLIVIVGALLAVAVAATRIGGIALPDKLFGFTWSEARLTFGLLATLTLIAYLIRSFGAGSGFSKGIGLYIATAGAICILVGAVIERLGAASDAEPSRPAGSGSGGPSPAALVLLGAGVLILIGSFLAAVSSDGDSKSAWGEGFFPLYTLPALLGVVIAAQAALAEFASVRLPAVLGLSWSKIRLSFGAWALLMMVCFLLGRVVVEGAEISKGVGFWIMLVAAIGLLVGAVMREQEASRPAAPPPAAPPPPPPPA